MRNAASALLFAATISSQLVGSASAAPRFGRFGMHIRNSNYTTNDVEEAALDTTKSSNSETPSTSSSPSLSPSLADEDTATSSSPQAGKFVGAGGNGVDNKPQTTFGGDGVDVSSFFTSSTHTSNDGNPTFTDDTQLFPSVVVTSSTPTTWPTPSPGPVTSSLTSSQTSVSSRSSQTFSSGSPSSRPPWSPPPGPAPSSNASPSGTHSGCPASSPISGVATSGASTSTVISSGSLPCDSSTSSAFSSSTSCSYSYSGGSSGVSSSCSSTSGTWTNTTSPSSTVTTPTISTDVTSWSVTNTTSDSCYTIPPGWATTVISIVHTSTVTWWGDPEDYTDPYEPVEIPTPCPTTAELSTSKSVVLTATTCNPSESTCAELAPPTTQYTSAEVGVSQIGSWTYTYYVTERNPAVEYSSSTDVPDYTGGGDGNAGPQTNNNNNHQTATQTDDDKVPNYGGTPTKDTTPHEAQNSHTNVVVEVRPTEVIINTVTISNNPSNPTTTVVTVGSDTFTIGPSAVIGAGATVTRAGSNGQAPSPTTTTINGVSVVVSGSVAVVGGTTFTIGTSPAIKTVDGQVVTIAPSGVAIAGVTIPVAGSGAGTQVIVAGGEMITAMGQSIIVVDGTTYTYGPGSATITEVIDDDTIFIGPSGVVIDGTTLGGSAADKAGTTFTIVGGATITEIGASILVINGHTYTVGPGTGTTTTEVGGETLTIGPDGVAISGGQTLTYPFGPTLTTTLHPGNTATADQASATATDRDDEEDAGFSVGRTPDLSLALGATCIAIGVGFFGFLI